MMETVGARPNRRPGSTLLELYAVAMTPELATAAKDFGVTAVLPAPAAVEMLVAAVLSAVMWAPGAPVAPVDPSVRPA